MRHNITQRFVDDLINKLPVDMLAGYKWRSVVSNVASISLLINKFNKQVVMHDWSSKGADYNKERNDEIWQFMLKQASLDKSASSLSWLMYKTNF